MVATGTHLQPSAHRGGGAEGADASRARTARGRRSTSTTARTSGASPATAPARSASSRAPTVTAKLQATLHLFDLIVGTEEEFHIAGGSTDTIAALRAVRAVSDATLVCKRGPMGAAAFTGRDPRQPRRGRDAGRASRSRSSTCSAPATASCRACSRAGSTDEPWPTALKYANACGAFAVSRHGCTPAYPSLGGAAVLPRPRRRDGPALRNDAALEQIHWSTNRLRRLAEMRVFAFDHRMQLEEMEGATPEKIGAFKELCLEAALAGRGRPAGLRHPLRQPARARRAVRAPPGTGLWIGRPVRMAGLASADAGARARAATSAALAEWPLEHVVKVLCFCHPDDDAAMWAEQEATVAAALRGRAAQPARVPARGHPLEGRRRSTTTTTATVIQRFYDVGVFPDWWKLEPMQTDAAWADACAAIERERPAHPRHRRARARRAARRRWRRASRPPRGIRW